jgi:glycerophosphoryl diester phosphodiesterase
VFLIAHRGASFDAPENTLAAVRLAWRQRADAVEVDVHLSRDGELVVIHDFNTRKTTGVNRKVTDLTLGEIRALDAGSWKGPAWKDEPIPTLEEILTTLPVRKQLFIEIKARADTVSALKKAFTRAHFRPEQITLIGFSLTAMKSLKRAFPKIEVCWIAKLKRHWRTRRSPDPDRLAQKIRDADLDGLDLCANEAITPAFVKKIHSAGLTVYVWTVDTRTKAEKMIRAGVDGITTNRPAWLREQMRL